MNKGTPTLEPAKSLEEFIEKGSEGILLGVKGNYVVFKFSCPDGEVLLSQKNALLIAKALIDMAKAIDGP